MYPLSPFSHTPIVQGLTSYSPTLFQKSAKSIVNVCSLKSRNFHKKQVVSLGEVRCVKGRKCPLFVQVALVSNQHCHKVVISFVSQIFQPLNDILKRNRRCDIINNHGSDCPIIQRRHASHVLFATWRVPYLCRNLFSVNGNGSGVAFSMGGGVGVWVETVA